MRPYPQNLHLSDHLTHQGVSGGVPAVYIEDYEMKKKSAQLTARQLVDRQTKRIKEMPKEKLRKLMFDGDKPTRQFVRIEGMDAYFSGYSINALAESCMYKGRLFGIYKSGYLQAKMEKEGKVLPSPT